MVSNTSVVSLRPNLSISTPPSSAQITCEIIARVEITPITTGVSPIPAMYTETNGINRP